METQFAKDWLGHARILRFSTSLDKVHFRVVLSVSMSKDEVVYLRFETSTYKALQRIAKEEQRTLSNLVRLAIDEWLGSRNGAKVRQD